MAIASGIILMPKLPTSGEFVNHNFTLSMVTGVVNIAMLAKINTAEIISPSVAGRMPYSKPCTVLLFYHFWKKYDAVSTRNTAGVSKPMVAITPPNIPLV